MIYQDSKAPKEIITRDVNQLEENTGNLYETINILAKRANQINMQIKMEIANKFEEFAALHVDTLNEVFENQEQIDISKYYERLAKPSAISIEEYEKEKLYFKYRESRESAEK